MKGKIFFSTIFSLFLTSLIFFSGFFIPSANAAIQTSINIISPTPATVDSEVQIKVSASDSKNSILLINFSVGTNLINDKIVQDWDCTNGTGNAVNNCEHIFTKSFSKGSYYIFGTAQDINGAPEKTDPIILFVGTLPPPSKDGPVITDITPNPAPINSIINISGTGFCSNIDPGISGIAIIFDQTAISGGTTISVSPSPPLPQSGINCSPLKVIVPSGLIPDNIVKISVSNNKPGMSDSVNLSLSSPLPPGPPPAPSTAGKLELNWPNSPAGTPLNSDSDLTVLIKYLYEWLIALGGLAAFVSLLIAGFQYTTSVGNSGAMGKAKERIQSAILGLVLLLSSFLILNIINPELTTLKMPTIKPPGETLTKMPIPPSLNFNQNCDKVKVFSQADYSGPIATIQRGEPARPVSLKESGSIRFEFTTKDGEKTSPEDGFCQATVDLYDITGRTIIGTLRSSVSDISSLYLEKDIRYIRVK